MSHDRIDRPRTHVAARFLPIVIAGLVTAVVRAMPAGTDLWLDEIWSLDAARRLSPWQLYSLRHDNNHLFNTLWMVLLGRGHPDVLYRLPSILAGTLVVGLGTLLTSSREGASRWTTWALLASSSLLIARASEARGYASMLCFALLALVVLECHVANPTRRSWLPLFWVCVVASVISHASGVSAYGAIAAYSVALRRPRWGWRAIAHEGLWLHVVPSVCLGLHYLFFLSSMKVGGGAPAAVAATVAHTAALTLGSPRDPATVWPAALVFGALLLSASYSSFAERDRKALLYVAGVLFPIVVLAASGVPHAAPRHLALSTLFALLLLGRTLGTWFDRGGAPRTVSIALLLTIVVLNVLGTWELTALGRGSYRAAVTFVLEHSAEGPITVASDHDFRNRVLLAHYARLQVGGDRLRYLTASALPPGGASWVIVHRVAGDARPPPPPLATIWGQRYKRALALPCSQLSGMSWYLYARMPGPPD